MIGLPRLGTINVHASLLPKLRGAAPIQAAIREGHDETGITIMRMVKALDAGPYILQARTLIPDDETYGELRLRLAELGALALIEALALIDLGRSVETPQNDADATYAEALLDLEARPLLLAYHALRGSRAADDAGAEALESRRLVLKKELAAKYPKQWKQYIIVFFAGYSCGVGLVMMLSLGVVFMSKAVYQSTF